MFEHFYNMFKKKKEWMYDSDGIDSKDNKNKNGEKIITLVWT